jgi:hypothetical protein
VQTKWFSRSEFERCLTNSFGQIITSSLPALSTLLRQFQVAVLGKGSPSVAAKVHTDICLASLIHPKSSDGASDQINLIMPGGVGRQREGSFHNPNDDAQSGTTSSIKSGCNAAKVEQHL